MKGWRFIKWLSWAMAAMVMVSGCAGVLFESMNQEGQTDRLKLEPGDSWKRYDYRPRDPYADSMKSGPGDMSIMLKSEKTF